MERKRGNNNEPKEPIHINGAIVPDEVVTKYRFARAILRINGVTETPVELVRGAEVIIIDTAKLVGWNPPLKPDIATE